MRPPVVAHLLMPADKPRRLQRTVASATVGRENKEVSVSRWHGSHDAATKHWEGGARTGSGQLTGSLPSASTQHTMT